MNTQTQEALKMAIDLLEDDLMDLVYEQDAEFKSKYAGGYKPERLKYAAELIVRGKEVIQACKEALAQPAQEPVAWNEEEFNAIAYAYRTCPAHEIKMVSDRYQELVNYVLSITHPAPSWQELSDDEIQSAPLYDEDFYRGAKWAEQALKEKNT